MLPHCTVITMFNNLSPKYNDAIVAGITTDFAYGGFSINLIHESFPEVPEGNETPRMSSIVWAKRIIEYRESEGSDCRSMSSL